MKPMQTMQAMRSLILLPLLFASCLVPRENAFDPLKGGLIARLLLSFQPTVLATSGTQLFDLSPYDMAQIGSPAVTTCASITGMATDTAGWRLVLACDGGLRIIERRELPGRYVGLGAPVDRVLYDEDTEIAVTFTTAPISVVAVDTRTATVLWKKDVSIATASMAILQGRLLVSFQTTAGPDRRSLTAFDLRTGNATASYTSDYSPSTTDYLRIAASPDGQSFASVESNTTPSRTILRRHNAATLQPIWTADVSSLFVDPPTAITVNLHEGFIYVGESIVMNLHFFDLNNGAQKSQISGSNPTAMVPSRFFNRLYTVEAGIVYARDPLTGTLIATSALASANSLAVIPGDRY